MFVKRIGDHAFTMAILSAMLAFSCGGGSDAQTSATSAAGSSGHKTSSSSKLAGTGESCQSFTPPADGKCHGWFCGVTEDELMAAVDPHAKCGSNVPLLCQGAVVMKVSECSRKVKSANLSKKNDALRPLVRDCVFEDESIKAAVPEDCLYCSIDAGACAADHCFAQCRSGDNPGCDACRRSFGCDQAVFECGGLPAPID